MKKPLLCTIVCINICCSHFFTRAFAQEGITVKDGKVGIGNEAPTMDLHIRSDASYRPQIKITNINNENNAGYLNFEKLPTDNILSPGDVLGTVIFRGKSTDNQVRNSAYILADVVRQNSTSISSEIEFWTTSLDGTLSKTSHISSEGQFKIKDGSATTPAYSFTNAGAMGMYKSGSSLAFTNQGEMRAYIGAGGDFVMQDDLIIGKGHTTQTANVLLGWNRTGNGQAQTAFYTDPGNDLDARLLRGQGTNGNLHLENRGLGNLIIETNNIEKARIDANGNLGLNSKQFGASSQGVLSIGVGQAPTSSPANSVQLYAADTNSSAELKVRDEAGNTTTLSPHNFSLIKNPSHEMAWSYYSEKDGMALNVDMFRVVQLLEQLTGEKLIHIEKIPKK